MAVTHGNSERSKTGAKRHKRRDKTKAELGSETPDITVGKTKKKNVKGRGKRSDKMRLRNIDLANVFDPKKKKHTMAKILNVKENKADRHYARRNIVTQGAIITTELGDARVTSRPGQDGVVNAVLIMSNS
jgi:small subunit ribosomal protein S8e